MAKTNYLYLILVLFIVVAVSGCSSVPKKVEDEVSGIKMRVDTLESRVEGVEAKQMESERMGGSTLEGMYSAEMEKSNIEVKSRSGKSSDRVIDIQTALKSAGYYNGKIDGIKGRNTRKAIREFQQANGLKADGIAGPKTWDILSKYLSGEAAGAAAPVAQEGATK